MPTARPTSDRDFLRNFWKLAVYNIAANLTVPLASLIDAAMLGRLPQVAALAGVALAGVLFDYVYWGFGFLRMATTGLTARADGAGDRAEVERILGRGALTAVAFGLGLILLQPLLREGGFALLAGAADVESAGRAYFNARIWGAPLALSNFVLLGWFLGRSQGRAVLWMVVVGNLTNIALDYLLILRLDYGPSGAGAATAIAQAAQLGTALAFLPAGTLAGLRRHLGQLLGRDRLLDFARMNFDIAVRTVLLISAFALFQNVGATLGTNTLAANAILLHLLALASYWIDGVAFATETWAGQAAGANDHAGLRRTLRLALAGSCGFAVLFAAAYMLWRQPLIGSISTHAEVVAGGSRFVPWLALTILVGAVAYALDGFFLGLTRTRLLRNAMALSFVLGFLPLLGLAALRADNTLLWASLVVFMLTRVVTLGVPALRAVRT